MSNTWQDASKVDIDAATERRELAENIRSVFGDFNIREIEAAMVLAMANDEHRGRVYVALKTVKSMMGLRGLKEAVRNSMQVPER